MASSTENQSNSAVPRSSAEIKYVRGVGQSTKIALDRLEDALARTASLSGTWSHNGPETREEEEVERAAIREISYLRSMQNQLASASSRLLETRVDGQPVVNEAATRKTKGGGNTSAAHVKLDQTLNRLHQATTREGILRMENLRLRQLQAENHLRGERNKNSNRNNDKRTISSSGSEKNVGGVTRFEQLLSGNKGTKNGTTAANLWLRCALLEEKNVQLEQRSKIAEANVEALTYQLRKIREDRATTMLTSEAELYHRVENGLMSVEEVAAPLAAIERKAAQRHEEISSHLTNIDQQVRNENATLQVRVNELEKRCSVLKFTLSGRPTRKEHMDVLRREGALMTEVRRLRDLNKKLKKGKEKKTIKVVKEKGEEKDGEKENKNKSIVEGKEGKKEIIEGKGDTWNISDDDDEIEIIVSSDDDEKKEEEKEDKDDKGKKEGNKVKEQVPTTTEDQIAMRVDRILSNLNTSDMSNLMSSMDNYTPNNTNKRTFIPISKKVVNVGWASLYIIQKLMNIYNIDSAMNIQSFIANLDKNSTSLIGFQECYHTIHTIVKNAKDDCIQPNMKDEERTKQEDDQESALNLGNVDEVQPKLNTLEELTRNIKVMLNERRILAFEQSQPEKVLHEILIHFQMIVNASNLNDIVPKMNEIMTRMKVDRNALNAIRKIYGLPSIDDTVHVTDKENDELVNIIREYAINAGITVAESDKKQHRVPTTTFVPSSYVRRVGRNRDGQY